MPYFCNNPYHQLYRKKQLDKPRINPYINLAKCITTSSSNNMHHAYIRQNTVPKLAAL
jgi:DNA (cytosine-5)-methyltransferase 1